MRSVSYRTRSVRSVSGVSVPKRPDLSPAALHLLVYYHHHRHHLCHLYPRCRCLCSPRASRTIRWRHVHWHARHASYVITASARILPGRAYLQHSVVVLISRLFLFIFEWQEQFAIIVVDCDEMLTCAFKLPYTYLLTYLLTFSHL